MRKRSVSREEEVEEQNHGKDLAQVLQQLAQQGRAIAVTPGQLAEINELRSCFEQAKALFDERTTKAWEELVDVQKLHQMVLQMGGRPDSLDRPMHGAMDAMVAHLCRQLIQFNRATKDKLD